MRYGMEPDKWTYKFFDGQVESVQCGSSAFGGNDPAWGSIKTCQLAHY
jgi:hypothetical protein